MCMLRGKKKAIKGGHSTTHHLSMHILFLVKPRERERERKEGEANFKEKVVMKCSSSTSECKKKVRCCVFGGI